MCAFLLCSYIFLKATFDIGQFLKTSDSLNTHKVFKICSEGMINPYPANVENRVSF